MPKDREMACSPNGADESCPDVETSGRVEDEGPVDSIRVQPAPWTGRVQQLGPINVCPESGRSPSPESWLTSRKRGGRGAAIQSILLAPLPPSAVQPVGPDLRRPVRSADASRQYTCARPGRRPRRARGASPISDEAEAWQRLPPELIAVGRRRRRGALAKQAEAEAFVQALAAGWRLAEGASQLLGEPLDGERLEAAEQDDAAHPSKLSVSFREDVELFDPIEVPESGDAETEGKQAEAAHGACNSL